MIETVNHLFIDCTVIRSLWHHVILKLSEVYNPEDNDSWEMVTLLGSGRPRSCKKSILVDLVLNIDKCTIWRCRVSALSDGHRVNVSRYFRNCLKQKLWLNYSAHVERNSVHQFYNLFAQKGVLVRANNDGGYTYHFDRG